MHPFILPHLMGGCVKQRLKRAAVFDSETSRYMTRVPGAAGNRRTHAISIWLKRTKLGTTQAILSVDAGGGSEFLLSFDANDRLRFASLNAERLLTTAVYRDPTAFMHIFLANDSTQATAGNRHRLWVNGVEVTSWATNAPVGLNSEMELFTALTHDIGRRTASPSGWYLAANVAEVCLIEGAASPSDVGAFDPRSGAWMPKAFLGAYGARGGLWPWVGDAGDAPATATEAAKDRSGGGNHWTPVNFTASDFVKDTPTNFRSGDDHRGNFCTWNPLRMVEGTPANTIHSGNLGYTDRTTGGETVCGTIAVSSGKWYWEITQTAQTSGQFRQVGIIAAAERLNRNYIGRYGPTGGYAYDGFDGLKKNTAGSDAGSAYGATWTTGDTIGVALDMDAGTLEFFKNGVSQGVAFAGISGLYQPAISLRAASALANFGQRAFAHAPPAGFKPLAVSAMPRPSIIKPGNAFARVVETGANIQAALAARRAGWSAWIEVYKRLDGADEGWRWRFSDDPGNYLDSSNAANPKQPFPVLAAGAQYAGFVLRVGAAFGVRTGVAAHVTGAPTTVNDGGVARKAVIIRHENIGAPWPMFHPDLPAGQLINLNSSAAPFAGTAIQNVMAGSFQIGAASASGDVRWIVLEDLPGGVSLGKYVSNNSNAGPLLAMDIAPFWLWVRLLAASTFGMNTFYSRPGEGNPVKSTLHLSVDDVQTQAAAGFDFLAGGVKIRDVGSDYNGAANTHIFVAFPEFVFAPGDCPAQATAR